MSSLDDFKPLVKHERDFTHIDHLATISAGYKNEAGNPVVSRDGTIYISDPEGRAPGLATILAQNGRKHLTIALPSNNLDEVLSQSFRKESRGRLIAHGNADGITTIEPIPNSKPPVSKRTFHAAGTPEFEALKLECQVYTVITFILADYTEDGQIVYPFPDSIGCYRLRTTSEDSAEKLVGCLRLIAKLNQGDFAGIPITVRLTYPQKSDPSGAKQKPPVWVYAVKAPPHVMLTSKTLPLLAAGAREAIGMTLPALPSGETIDDAILECEASAKEIHALETGLEEARVRDTWFSIVKDTPWDTDAARAALVKQFTQGATHSLAEFLAGATPETANGLLEVLRVLVEAGADPGSEDLGAVYTAILNPPPKPASKEEIKTFWKFLKQNFGEAKATDVLGGYLEEFGALNSSELTSDQIALATRKANAKLAMEAA